MNNTARRAIVNIFTLIQFFMRNLGKSVVENLSFVIVDLFRCSIFCRFVKPLTVILVYLIHNNRSYVYDE